MPAGSKCFKFQLFCNFEAWLLLINKASMWSAVLIPVQILIVCACSESMLCFDWPWLVAHKYIAFACIQEVCDQDYLDILHFVDISFSL